MSEEKKIYYTPEFRESAVKLAIVSDQPVSVTAEELGIDKNTLHTGTRKYYHPNMQLVGRVEEEHLYDELKISRKENA